MYDIFFVSQGAIDQAQWSAVKARWPNAQAVENCKNIRDISSKSFTKMFWVIWDDLEVLDSFDINEHRATKWDDVYVHVFKNGEHKDGICLFQKIYL